MNRFVKIGSIVFLCGIIMASMSEAKTHQANVSNSVALRNNNSSGSSKGTTHSNSNTTKRSTSSSSTKTTSNNKNNSSSKGTTHSNSNTTKRSTSSSSTKTTSNNKNNSSSKGTTHSNSNTTKRSTSSSSTKTTSNNKNNSSNKGTTRPSSNTTKQPTNNSSPKPTSDNKNSNSNKGTTRPGSNVTNQPTDAVPNNKANGNNSGAIRPGGNVTNHPTNNPSTIRNNNRNSLGNTGIKWESKSDRPRYKYSNLHPKRIPLRPYKRPTPPHSFRPHRGCPIISDILGLTIGMALDLSMDYLFNKGYIIDRYGDNIVCLRDVNEFGFLWPYVILYYDDAGGLVGSQFSYSTSYYDLSRYNSLYNRLISRYGNPVSTQNTETGLGSTWFGYDNQYISIGFTPMYAENGQLRYYTTLAFGV